MTVRLDHLPIQQIKQRGCAEMTDTMREMTVSLDMEEGMRGQDMRDMTVGRKSLDMIGMVDQDGKKGQDMKGMVGGRKDLRNMVGEEKDQGMVGGRKDLRNMVGEEKD